jgi:hypothetical protein
MGAKVFSMVLVVLVWRWKKARKRRALRIPWHCPDTDCPKTELLAKHLAHGPKVTGYELPSFGDCLVVPCHQSYPPNPVSMQHLPFPREPPPRSLLKVWLRDVSRGSAMGNFTSEATAPVKPSTIPRLWLILAVRSDQRHPEIVTPG